MRAVIGKGQANRTALYLFSSLTVVFKRDSLSEHTSSSQSDMRSLYGRLQLNATMLRLQNSMRRHSRLLLLLHVRRQSLDASNGRPFMELSRFRASM